MNPVDPIDGNTQTSSPASVEAADLPTMSLDKTLPRQVSTGSQRGTQAITGNLLVVDPTTQLNRILIGQLPDGTFGIVVSKEGVDVLNVFN